jgi:hypothetical protein
MGQGEGRSQCALWGGVSLGVGTLAYALFSPSSVGCSTNVVVLTHGGVTERGCAAYSVMSHAGVGLMVLGAVLLLGSFALAVRWRRQEAASPVDALDSLFGTAGESVAPVTRRATTVSAGPVVSAGVVERAEVLAVPEADPTPPAPRPVVPEPIPEPEPEPEPRPETRPEPRPEPKPEPVQTRRPIAPGEDVYEPAPSGPHGLSVQLPPGWYGNPDIPGKPVQWWDGTKLTDGPP